jgi:hypothetical protein
MALCVYVCQLMEAEMEMDIGEVVKLSLRESEVSFLCVHIDSRKLILLVN